MQSVVGSVEVFFREHGAILEHQPLEIVSITHSHEDTYRWAVWVGRPARKRYPSRPKFSLDGTEIRWKVQGQKLD
jgi:hypothetical protein